MMDAKEQEKIVYDLLLIESIDIDSSGYTCIL